MGAGLPASPALGNFHEFEVMLSGKGRNHRMHGRRMGVAGAQAVSAKMGEVSKGIAILSRSLDEILNPHGVASTLVRDVDVRAPKSSNSGDMFRIILVPKGPARSLADKWSKRLGRLGVHDRAWGFARGKSCVDMCRAHSVYWGAEGRGDVTYLSMDLEGFFPSITGEMVERSMAAHGFSEADIQEFIGGCMVNVGGGGVAVGKVSEALERSCVPRGTPGIGRVCRSLEQSVTSSWFSDWTPGTDYLAVLDEFQKCAGPIGEESRQDYLKSIHRLGRLVFGGVLGMGPSVTQGSWVLPQGSPVSPHMSNLVAKKLDMRLAPYLEKCGCFYTRYADDLTISWGGRMTRREIALIVYGVSKIARSEGFVVRRSKTLVMGPGMRQSVLGYAMNSGKPTIPKAKRREASSRAVVFAAKARDGWSSAMEVEAMSIMGTAEHISSAHWGEGSRIKESVASSVQSMRSCPSSSRVLAVSGHDNGSGCLAGPSGLDRPGMDLFLSNLEDM